MERESPHVQVAQCRELRNNTVVKKTEDKTRDQVAKAILEGGPATQALMPGAAVDLRKFLF